MKKGQQERDSLFEIIENYRELKAWIFQVNRKYYRFFDLIQSGNFNKEWWHVVRFQKEIRRGDVVFFWLTDKHAYSKDAGIYALGEVILAPQKISQNDCLVDFCTPEFHERFPSENFEYPHFRCNLVKEFIDRPLLKESLRDNHILKFLTVITTRGRGTNFRVTQEQLRELRNNILDFSE